MDKEVNNPKCYWTSYVLIKWHARWHPTFSNTIVTTGKVNKEYIQYNLRMAEAVAAKSRTSVNFILDGEVGRVVCVSGWIKVVTGVKWKAFMHK